MRLSNAQALVLFEIAKDSLRLSDGGNIFTFSIETRSQIVNQIINQQDNEIIDLDLIDKKEEIE